MKTELTNIANRDSTEISEKISEAIGECSFEFVVDNVLEGLTYSPDETKTIEKLISVELEDFLSEGMIKANEERCCYYWPKPFRYFIKKHPKKDDYVIGRWNGNLEYLSIGTFGEWADIYNLEEAKKEIIKYTEEYKTL